MSCLLLPSRPPLLGRTRISFFASSLFLSLPPVRSSLHAILKKWRREPGGLISRKKKIRSRKGGNKIYTLRVEMTG